MVTAVRLFLGDIAVLTKANAVYKDLGIDLESVKLSDLGKARKISLTSENTTIVGGAGSKADIDGRAEQIRLEIEVTDSEYDREKTARALGQNWLVVSRKSIVVLRQKPK